MAALKNYPARFPLPAPLIGGAGLAGWDYGFPKFPKTGKTGLAGNHRKPVFNGAKGWNHARSRL